MPNRLALVPAALAILAPLSGCSTSDPQGAPGDDPVKAVKEFIIDGAVDQNGFSACAFLTTHEQRAAVKRTGGPECRQAFDLSAFRLGGQTIDTVHEVDHLAADSTVRHGRAFVRLTKNGQSARFELVKATRAEQEQFLAPETEWRIAAGDLRIVPKERL